MAWFIKLMEEGMKRFIYIAGFCALFLLSHGCSFGGLDDAADTEEVTEVENPGAPGDSGTPGNPGSFGNPGDSGNPQIPKEPGNPGNPGGPGEIIDDDSTGPGETGNEGPTPDPEIPGPKPELPKPSSFLSANIISETEINFEFTRPVQVVSLSFVPELEIDSIEEGSTVTVLLEKSPAPGIIIKAVLLAEDEVGNIISVLSSLRSRNYRVPELLINELRTEYSKPRAEYIEFKILTSGNLGALRLFAAGNTKNPMIYEFPPVEVAAGEYVVLHMRTLEDSCVDELGEQLDESGGRDSCPTARDLWIPGSTKLLHKTDAVYVMDQDDRVLTAVMLSETPDPWWKKDHFVAAAGFLFNQNAFKSIEGGICSPIDAVSSANIKTSYTRSISRDETVENSNTAADWYVTVTGGASPGLPNNPNRF